MLKVKDVLSDIARLGEENDEALREHDDCLEAIDAKAGHPKYDAIFAEVHTDELTCKELEWVAKSWRKEARKIMKERTELRSMLEKNKVSLADFDANEFHTTTLAKLTDDERSFYERVTRDLDKSHPVQERMGKEELKKLLASMQDDCEALEDVDILDPSAECAENDKLATTRLATFAAEDDDRESEDGIEDDDDEPQSIIEAQKWHGFRVPGDMVAQLQEHQRKGLELMCERAANNSGTLLAHAPGLGKTLTTLCFLSCHKFERKTARSIVVCDKTLLMQWEAQVSKFNSFLNLQAFTVDDASKLVFLHSQWKRTRGGVLIIHTELFRAQFPVKDSAAKDSAAVGSKRSRDKAHVAQPRCILDITANTVVVVDEAHKFLQTGHSEFYKVVSQLATKLLILLTGTPMQHSLSKYYNMVRLVAPDLLPPTNMGFKNKYANKILEGARAKADRDAQHDADLTMHILVEDLKKAVAYVTADDFLKDTLPPKLEFIITHPLDDDADPYADWSGRGMEKREKVYAASRYTKTLIFCGLMHNFGMTERCLVFSSRLDTLKFMKEAYESDERHCGLLTGEVTNIYDRNAIIYEFSETPGSVLFISTELGACGLDLSVASRVILADVSWNPLEEEQAVARAYRLGQERSVFVYRLVAANTAEQKAYELGIQKRRLASTIKGESTVACVYKDSDLIVGTREEKDEQDADFNKYDHHMKGQKLLHAFDKSEEDRLDHLLDLLEEKGIKKEELDWAVHDVNVTVEEEDGKKEWIRNQYDNEVNRRKSLEATAIYDDDGNLVTPTPVALLGGHNTNHPCVNFYYPEGEYTPGEEEDKEDMENEDKEDIKNEKNKPHRKIMANFKDGFTHVCGIFAPSPDECLANGVDVELYRLELTEDPSFKNEYDESDWVKMEMDLRELSKIGALHNGILKMTDILDEHGVFLFAKGLWVYKIRLVDASGEMSCFSQPSAIVNIQERKQDADDMETDEE